MQLDRDPRLALSMAHYHDIVPIKRDRDRWAVRTTGYEYTLYVVSEREERELFSYQWHPRSRSDVIFPHLHLGSRLLNADLPFAFNKVPLPTGSVTLATVLRIILDDLKITSLRSSWETDLSVCDAVMRAAFGTEDQPLL